MLFITTHTDPEQRQLIDDIAGRPYSFWDKIKMGGVGSGRMIIEEASPKLQQTLRNGHDLNYANIELRPKGILVRITRRMDNFAWVIPYYKLHLYKTNGISLHANGQFIYLRKDRMLRNNSRFFKKLLEIKSISTREHYVI